MAPRDTPELERRLQNVTERLLIAFEELDFLHSMSSALARPGAMEDVYRFLLEESLSLFHADGGWLARTRPRHASRGHAGRRPRPPPPASRRSR